MRAKAADEDVVFTLASDDQQDVLIEDRAQLWSAPLPARDYVHIQDTLAQTEASKDSLEYWVLHLPDRPEAIVSSCTVHIRPAFVTAGKRTVSKAAVISHVYTVPRHRLRGLATILLSNVQKELDGRTGEDSIDFSVLYSSPYVDFFYDLGWQPQPATQLRITLGSDQVPYPSVDDAELLQWPDIQKAVEHDARACRLRIKAKKDGRIKGAEASKKTHVQLAPSPAVAKWHLMREALHAQQLGKRPNKSGMKNHGAASVTDGVPSGVCAWWVRDLVRCQLILCRMAERRLCGMEKGAMAVLQAAVAEAGIWGLREVVVWQPTAQVVLGAQMLGERGVRVVMEERMDLVPCLRWSGGEERDVEWEANEYYGWC